MKNRGRGFLAGLSLCLMLVLFLQPAAAMEYIRRGMSLCVRTMIPSLFPFMVVSELIVRSGAGERIARYPARLMHLSAEGVCAWLLGVLCGFPVGSRAAADYYRAGRLTARQFNLTLAVCNVPSSAFLVCAVGLSLFGSRTFGRGLIVLTLLSSLVAGLLLNWLLPRGKTESSFGGDQRIRADSGEAGLFVALPRAIGSAAQGMLGVCATVLLFSALMGALTGIFDRVLSGDTSKAILLGMLEMSGGVCALSLLSDRHLAAILCTAAIGWGGLSVHCQIFSVCGGCPVDVRIFWIGRALQALVCGVGMWLWTRMSALSLPDVPQPMAWRNLLEGRETPMAGFARVWIWGCCLAFITALLLRCLEKRRRDRT